MAVVVRGLVGSARRAAEHASQHVNLAVLAKVPPRARSGLAAPGLRAGMCPLCRVPHKADREYIWHFFDEGAGQGESIDTVRRACRFCGGHVEMLRRIEVDGMNSTLSLSTLFAIAWPGSLRILIPSLRRLAFVARRAACAPIERRCLKPTRHTSSTSSRPALDAGKRSRTHRACASRTLSSSGRSSRRPMTVA